MGDECHNRHIAATSLLFKALAPPLVRAAGRPRDASPPPSTFIAGNNYFFLNLAMAACKAMLAMPRTASPAARSSRRWPATAPSSASASAAPATAGSPAPAAVPRGPLLPRLQPGRRGGRHRRQRHHRDRRAWAASPWPARPPWSRSWAARPADASAYTEAMYEHHPGRATTPDPAAARLRAARPPASTCATWSTPTSCRSSTRASPTARRASARWRGPRPPAAGLLHRRRACFAAEWPTSVARRGRQRAASRNNLAAIDRQSRCKGPARCALVVLPRTAVLALLPAPWMVSTILLSERCIPRPGWSPSGRDIRLAPMDREPLARLRQRRVEILCIRRSGQVWRASAPGLPAPRTPVAP